MKHSEKAIQQRFRIYVQKKYPSLKFTSMGNFSSAKDALKSVKMGYCKHIPDIIVFEQRGIYPLAMIELKTEEVRHKDKIIVRKGVLNDGQSKMISEMIKKGYFACAAYGFKSAIDILNVYMSLESGDTINICN